jgi:hypothetical protein
MNYGTTRSRESAAKRSSQIPKRQAANRDLSLSAEKKYGWIEMSENTGETGRSITVTRANLPPAHRERKHKKI